MGLDDIWRDRSNSIEVNVIVVVVSGVGPSERDRAMSMVQTHSIGFRR